MADKLLTSEELTYCTVRIEAQLTNGHISVGTGFFFSFHMDDNSQIPVLITNKHVIENSIKGKFFLHSADKNGKPQIDSNFVVELDDFQRMWILHPDPSADLCIMPIGPILHDAKLKGKQVFLKSLSPDLIPTITDLEEFGALEEIIMIGYPIGIWDVKNNMPIIRRGITATHISINYEGRQEFLIDAACFPGSSGSPILLYSTSAFTNRSGRLAISFRLKLLGILYAGPQYTNEGEIVTTNVPTRQKTYSISQIPINLGICIKAERIMEFEPIIKKMSEDT